MSELRASAQRAYFKTFAKRNYEWKSVCFDNGFSRQEALKIMDEANLMINFTNQVIIIILLQIFIQLFFCQLLFMPFSRAYLMNETEEVYKEALYRSIREGEHQMFKCTRKLINSAFNCMQIALLIYLIMNFKKNQQMFKLIEEFNCSDEVVNRSLETMSRSIKHGERRRQVILGMIWLNFYIDYFGLYLSFSENWIRMYRKVALAKRRCVECICCRWRQKPVHPDLQTDPSEHAWRSLVGKLKHEDSLTQPLINSSVELEKKE